jgi:hypothetical protein
LPSLGLHQWLQPGAPIVGGLDLDSIRAGRGQSIAEALRSRPVLFGSLPAPQTSRTLLAAGCPQRPARPTRRDVSVELIVALGPYRDFPPASGIRRRTTMRACNMGWDGRGHGAAETDESR